MKTSKRKRSAKAQPVIEAVGTDVLAAEMPVAVELSPAAVEALIAEPALEAVVEPVAEAVAEPAADVSNEQAAEVAAEPVIEPVVAELAAEAVVAEPVADVSNEQAAEEVAAVEPVIEAVVAEPAADVSIEQAADEVAVEPVAEAPVEQVAEVAAEPAVIGDPIVVLGSNCSVKDAAALKTSLCAFSNHSDAVTLDVSAVERVDTATMQLLCAFVRDRSGRNQSVTWRGESQALQDAVRLLGVGELLGLETKGVAA